MLKVRINNIPYGLFTPQVYCEFEEIEYTFWGKRKILKDSGWYDINMHGQPIRNFNSFSKTATFKTRDEARMFLRWFLTEDKSMPYEPV